MYCIILTTIINKIIPDRKETITIPIILPIFPATKLLLLILLLLLNIWVGADEINDGGLLNESIGWSKNEDEDD